MTPPRAVTARADGVRDRKTRARTTIEVQGTPITVLSRDGEDFISLTDMVRHFEGGGALIEQWLRNKDTTIDLCTGR
jgi:hypothetical protein